MRKRAGASLLVLAGLCLVALGANYLSAEGGKTATIWPAGDIKWADNPAIKGAKVAVLWGDPNTGPYGALRTVPAGTNLALHTHTHDQKVIAVAGMIVLTVEGAAPKTLGAGSYAFIPGGTKHSAECKTGAECKYFEESAGAGDLKYVEVKK